MLCTLFSESCFSYSTILVIIWITVFIDYIVFYGMTTTQFIQPLPRRLFPPKNNETLNICPYTLISCWCFGLWVCPEGIPTSPEAFSSINMELSKKTTHQKYAHPFPSNSEEQTFPEAILSLPWFFYLHHQGGKDFVWDSSHTGFWDVDSGEDPLANSRWTSSMSKK